MVEVASWFVFTDIVLLSSKLIYTNMNVDMTNSDVDVQSSMLHYNFDFWRRWNAMHHHQVKHGSVSIVASIKSMQSRQVVQRMVSNVTVVKE